MRFCLDIMKVAVFLWDTVSHAACQRPSDQLGMPAFQFQVISEHVTVGETSVNRI
jgi:hypothetical protein